MGLNKEFRQVRSDILAMNSLPNLGKTFQMIVHEEAQHGLHEKQNVDAHAFYASRFSSVRPITKSSEPSHVGKAPMIPSSAHSKKRPPPPTKPIYYKSRKQINTKYYCDHCSAFGHTEDRCYVLHGYPEGHKQVKFGSSSTLINATQNKPRSKAVVNCATTSRTWSAWDKERTPEDDSIRDGPKENPIEPHGFPLYSKKYNPKPNKYDSGDEEDSWSG